MRSTRHLSTLTGLCALVAFVLGITGFVSWFPHHAWHDQVYHTLQLYVLELDDRENIKLVLEDGVRIPQPIQPMPVGLAIARFLAPLSLALGAALAVLRYLSASGRSLRLKWSRGHTVIAGANPRAVLLAEGAIKANKNVVLIAPPEKAARLEGLQSQGAIVVEGEYDDQAALARCQVRRAAQLIAFSDDDSANVRCIVGPEIQLLKQVSLDGVSFVDADTAATGPTGLLGWSV